jgi:hypothetical protein
MRWLVVLVLVGGVAYGSPLGITWRASYPTKDCAAGLDAGGELVGWGKHALVFFDRATGKQRRLALPKIDGKRPGGGSLQAVIGDTVIAGSSLGPLGIDAKTGALRWHRPEGAKGPYRHIQPSGATHAVEVDITNGTPIVLAVERFDAATGTTAWKADVPTKRARFTAVVTSTKHVFVISDDIRDKVGFTIVAFDLAGKQAWSVDDPIGYTPVLTTSGDDLVAISDNEITTFVGASGVKGHWAVDWSAHPVAAGGAVYAAPSDRSVEAYDLSAAKLWTTKLPDTAVPRSARVLGAASGFVYVADGDFVHTLEARTGKLLGSTGIPDMDVFAIHAGAPAFTLCGGRSGRSLVAYDPSKPPPEHTITIRGRIRCKNCDATTPIEVHIGNRATVLDTDGTFTLEVVARGTLALQVRDASFSVSSRIQLVDFNVDRTFTLGDVRVTIPQPGELE